MAALLLKSIVVGTEPPSAMLRFRNTRARSGGIPGVTIREPMKSMSPPLTPSNVTGVVDAAPWKYVVTRPYDTTPHGPGATPGAVPRRVFAGRLGAHVSAPSAVRSAVEPKNRNVAYRSTTGACAATG